MSWTRSRKRVAAVLGILLALYVASYTVISRSFQYNDPAMGLMSFYVPEYMLPDRRWQVANGVLSLCFYPLALVDHYVLGGVHPGSRDNIPSMAWGTETHHPDGSVTEYIRHANPGRAGGNSFAIIERDPAGKVTKVTWQSWDAGRDPRTDAPSRTEDKLPPWW